MHSINNTELSSLEETRCQFNGGRCAIKLGIDVHQEFYVVVMQEGGANSKPPQRFHKQRNALAPFIDSVSNWWARASDWKLRGAVSWSITALSRCSNGGPAMAGLPRWKCPSG